MQSRINGNELLSAQGCFRCGFSDSDIMIQPSEPNVLLNNLSITGHEFLFRLFLLFRSSCKTAFKASVWAARTDLLKAGSVHFVLEHSGWTLPMRDVTYGALAELHRQWDCCRVPTGLPKAFITLQQNLIYGIVTVSLIGRRSHVSPLLNWAYRLLIHY